MAAQAEAAIIISAQDKASKAFQKVQSAGSSAAQKLKANWGKITVAASAAAAGIEAVGRRAAEESGKLQQLANATGLAEEKLREMVVANTSAVTSTGDVLQLMKAAQKQGLDTAAGIQQYVQTWSTVADATDANIEELMRFVPALQSAGIAADNQKAALAALGFVHRNTNLEMQDYLETLADVNSEQGGVRMSANQLAAVMKLLEDKGLSAQIAMQRLTAANGQSEGSMKKLLEILGISQKEFEKTTKSVEGFKNALAEDAKAKAENVTVTQKLQAMLSKLSMQYGSLIVASTNLVPVLAAMGPVLGGLATAWGALSGVIMGSVVPALATATANFIILQIAGGPILWIIEAIIAAVALLVVAWTKDWGGIQEKTKATVGWIGEKLNWLWTFVKDMFKKIGEAVIGALKWIGGLWLKIVTGYFTLWQTVFTRIYDFVKGVFGEMVDWITGIGGRLYEAGKGIFTQLWDGLKAKWAAIKEWFIGKLQWLVDHIPHSPAKMGPLRNLRKGGQGIMNELAAGMRAGAPSALDVAKRLAVHIQTQLSGIGFRNLLKTGTFLAGYGQLADTAAAPAGGGSGGTFAATAGGGGVSVSRTYNNTFNISENIFESETKLRKVARLLAPYIEEEKSR